MLSRRDCVKGGVALVTIGTTAQSLLKGAVAFAAQHPEAVAGERPKTLILVQLAGGNDGLRTLIPYEDGNYFDARPTLAIDPEEVLPLDDGLGLHPNLRGLHELWSEGKLAVLQGVGYPNQNYSHFKSMAIWQAGDPELSFDNGWLGRTLEAMESEIHDPLAGFNIGTSTPPELRNATVPITSVQDPDQFGIRVQGRPASPEEPRTAALLKLYEEYPSSSPFGVFWRRPPRRRSPPRSSCRRPGPSTNLPWSTRNRPSPRDSRSWRRRSWPISACGSVTSRWADSTPTRTKRRRTMP